MLIRYIGIDSPYSLLYTFSRFLARPIVLLYFSLPHQSSFNIKLCSAARFLRRLYKSRFREVAAGRREGRSLEWYSARVCETSRGEFREIDSRLFFNTTVHSQHSNTPTYTGCFQPGIDSNPCFPPHGKTESLTVNKTSYSSCLFGTIINLQRKIR